MLFMLVFPGMHLVGALLVVVGVTSLGCSFVLLNSFLPLLVANHPTIRELDGLVSGGDDIPMIAVSASDDDVDSLDGEEMNGRATHDTVSNRVPMNETPSQLNTTSPALKLSNEISSKGVGIGYAAALFVQILGIGIVVLFSKLSPALSKTSIPTRAVLFLVGAWWATFTIPTALWLRRRPGPPLPLNTISKRRWMSWISYIYFAWASLWRTIKVAIQLRQVILFLSAWFLMSDAIATVSGTAILFARTELHMGAASTAAISIVSTVSGILGAFLWPKIGRRFGLPSNYIIIACLSLYEIIPLYGLLGFIPFIKSWGVIGLQKPWEIFPMAVVHGFIMGGISSHCRAFFGVLIPPGSEAAFYALMAVTDKGSSVIGPAVVGRIVDGTGSIRAAFWFLSPLIALPIPLLYFVDVERGRGEAVAMSEKLRGGKGEDFEDEVGEQRDELLGNDRD
jgi:UMF1 family MFS transporter